MTKRTHRWDWIALPMLGVLTILILAVSGEFIARREFAESKTTLNDCLVLNDPTRGVRGIPNSVCWEKIPENRLTEYKLDCRGYRTGILCGPKAQGIYRIVLIGSSVAMGERVPIESTFASLLPKEISRMTGRKVELYNEGMGYGFPRNAALRFSDVLAAQPDLILWVLTLPDIKLASFLRTEDSAENPNTVSASRPTSIRSVVEAIKDTIKRRVGNPLIGTENAVRHLMYEYKTQGAFIQSYVTMTDDEAGVWDAGPAGLRADPSAEWKAHLAEFNGYAKSIEEKAAAAGVPLVAVMAPNRAQAAMISMGEWPSGFDPYRADRDVGSIITAHGGTYIDILPEFSSVPNAETHYYPLDGHPDARGHAVIAEFLATQLTDGAVPWLRAIASLQSAFERKVNYSR